MSQAPTSEFRTPAGSRTVRRAAHDPAGQPFINLDSYDILSQLIVLSPLSTLWTPGNPSQFAMSSRGSCFVTPLPPGWGRFALSHRYDNCRTGDSLRNLRCLCQPAWLQWGKGRLPQALWKAACIACKVALPGKQESSCLCFTLPCRSFPFQLSNAYTNRTFSCIIALHNQLARLQIPQILYKIRFLQFLRLTKI